MITPIPNPQPPIPNPQTQSGRRSGNSLTPPSSLRLKRRRPRTSRSMACWALVTGPPPLLCYSLRSRRIAGLYVLRCLRGDICPMSSAALLTRSSRFRACTCRAPRTRSSRPSKSVSMPCVCLDALCLSLYAQCLSPMLTRSSRPSKSLSIPCLSLYTTSLSPRCLPPMPLSQLHAPHTMTYALFHYALCLPRRRRESCRACSQRPRS